MIGFALVTITAPVVGVIAGGRFADYLVIPIIYFSINKLKKGGYK